MKLITLKGAIFILIVGIYLPGCKNTADRSSAYSGTLQPDYVPDYLADTCFAGSKDFFALASVEAFYKKRSFRTAWSKNKKLNQQADSMLLLIRTSGYSGLSPYDYHLNEIEKLLVLLKTTPGDSLYLAQMDKMLTNSFLTMAYHLGKGRINLTNYKKIEKALVPDSLHIALLEKGLINNSLRSGLESLEPTHPQYILLKEALKNNLGQQEVLVGNLTNTSVADKGQLQKLEINMERWRQENKDFSQSYIFINIPSFQLNVIQDNETSLNSKVIVGKAATPTPVFDGMVECFTIYPYWTVPRSIATKDLLPKIKKDIHFLEKQFYQVLDKKGNILEPHSIDWQALSENNFPYTLRQTEGEYNALGIVKFMFDNPYSVYLHDTNSRSLFNKENRALSYGCIRVEKYSELAQILVQNDPAFQDPQTLQKWFKVQKRRTVNLLEPVPVYIRYFTAEVKDGSILFYNDIYKKDEKISKVLFRDVAI